MKKIIYSLALLGIFSFSACSLDVEPKGEIPDSEALNSVSDCYHFRTGLYTFYRSVTTGSYITASDIQADLFHPVVGNGNRNGTFTNGQILPNNSTIGGIFSGYYVGIAEANFLMQGINNLRPSINEASLQDSLNHYMADCYFTRAFAYSELADKFCASYKNSNVEKEHSGLPIVTRYSPTANRNNYPSRSSLKETYKQINDDLDSALVYMNKYEASRNSNQPSSMSAYVNSDIIKALQARVALEMGEDQKALDIAKLIIASGRYPLCELLGSNTFDLVWTKDEGTEILMRVQMDLNNTGAATGSAYLSTQGIPDFVPTNDIFNIYSTNDKRGIYFFQDNKIVMSTGTYTNVFSFIKYPGNSSLKSGIDNFKNMSKPFRVAELYLICAEAASNLGDESTANSYLNELKLKRISKYKNKVYTGSELVKEIRDERLREMVGEGKRMSDLKRWNIGFKRGEAQEPSMIIGKAQNISYEAGDYRFVWPIPQEEMEANTQLAGQQNPGY